MWFLFLCGFVIGLATGLYTMYKLRTLPKTAGSIVINSVDPEKDVFILKDVDLDALYNEKTVVFKIVNEDKTT